MSKVYDKQSAKNHVIGMIRQSHIEDEETDSDGQILIYTGIYKWEDGSLHAEEEPKKTE